MSAANALTTPVWRFFVKGRPVRTDAPIVVRAEGHVCIPAAAMAALDFPDRCHFFVAETEPGLLWICPAEPDDTSAYTLVSRGTDRRETTVAGLCERLGIDPDADIARGEWTIQDERVVVRFEVPG